ncbi:MAG: cytochrome c family protein [Rhodobacteraceae bacterium]|nr:cytochrome c family protein [Paracoccaceae bacterium]
MHRATPALAVVLALTAVAAVAQTSGRDTGQPVTPGSTDNGAALRPAFDPDFGVDLDALYASADPIAGEAYFRRRCQVCHSLDPNDNGIGPSLFDVVGAPVNFVQGYNYTGALAHVGSHWTVAALSRFLARPADAAPGTSMAFFGTQDRTDRLNLIRFLQEGAR